MNDSRRSSVSRLPWRLASESRATHSVAVANWTRCPARHARIETAIERCVLPVPGDWASHYSCCGVFAGAGAADRGAGRASGCRAGGARVAGRRWRDAADVSAGGRECWTSARRVGPIFRCAGAPERPLGVLGSPAAWRLLAAVAEGVRERRPGRGGACGENGGRDVGAARVVGQREGDRAGGGVGDAAGWRFSGR